MGSPSDSWHRLNEVDKEHRTATCSICGPTAIRLRSNPSRTPECMTARRATKKKDGPRSPAQQLKERVRKYNLRPDAAAVVVAAVLGGTATCPICLRAGSVMQIDHDHACCPAYRSCAECARGYICQNCNRGLGQFRDNADALRRAADYLERPPFQQPG